MKEEYNKNPKLCQACEEPIPYAKRRNKYCNHSCAASITNKGNTNNLREGKWKKKPCEECGEVTDNAKFCSRICFNIDKRKKVEEKIEAGEYTTLNGDCSFLRDYLIRKRGHQCEKCKNTEWMGEKIPLNVHHENGNAMENHPSNILLLCLNCHGLTPNFGAKNKNSTRIYRYAKK